jgi:uncharacterized protein YicC (UPF0701 family)
MTGFGSGEAPLAGGRLSIEVRSVNHRFLDLRLHLPDELAGVAFTIEQRLRGQLGRGRFDVQVRLAGPAPADASGTREAGPTRSPSEVGNPRSGTDCIDRERARAAFRALAELRDELAPGSELPLAVLGAIPEIFHFAPRYDDAAVLAAFDAASQAALAELTRMRDTEGGALAADIRVQLGRARASSSAIASASPANVTLQRERLQERVRRLLTSDVALDPGRLEQEVAILADRCDVSEELARLAAHCEQLDGLLGSEGALGRKIDFLLQEMAREANTIGSKSQSAAVAREVVELKTAIERMREQAQNLE